jgi:hypothetical protein
MEILNAVSVILGSSWTSGVNLYLTVAGLGIAHRMQWITLPGNMDVISHPVIITLAIVLYLVEFFADKIPYVDTAWDSIHTIIRPIGGATLAYLGTSETAPIVQTAMTLMGGTIALDSHATKASARVAINTSPEPVTNSVASVIEDILVAGAIWIMIVIPIVIGVFVALFVLFSIWFLPKMFRLIGKGFKFLFSKKESIDDKSAKFSQGIGDSE